MFVLIPNIISYIPSFDPVSFPHSTLHLGYCAAIVRLWALEPDVVFRAAQRALKHAQNSAMALSHHRVTIVRGQNLTNLGMIFNLLSGHPLNTWSLVFINLIINPDTDWSLISSPRVIFGVWLLAYHDVDGRRMVGDTDAVFGSILSAKIQNVTQIRTPGSNAYVSWNVTLVEKARAAIRMHASITGWYNAERRL